MVEHVAALQIEIMVKNRPQMFVKTVWDTCVLFSDKQTCGLLREQRNATACASSSFGMPCYVENVPALQSLCLEALSMHMLLDVQLVKASCGTLNARCQLESVLLGKLKPSKSMCAAVFHRRKA